jgi:hypothetical protein
MPGVAIARRRPHQLARSAIGNADRSEAEPESTRPPLAAGVPTECIQEWGTNRPGGPWERRKAVWTEKGTPNGKAVRNGIGGAGDYASAG